ncbi:uncharacterized protein LOC143354867 [Halictus rubicundus]|uniref:uncharacterized protein LOC143354867 n=1 Tax=Halictus rubicundus TaxID=77578 RepID=UPI0040373664
MASLLGSLVKEGEKVLGLAGVIEDKIKDELELLAPEDMLESNPINEVTPSETLAQTQLDLSDRVLFYLYTRANPTEGQKLFIGDVDALQTSNFDFSKPTKIVTHGWINTVLNDAVSLVRDAYLQHGDYNVVGIDWGKISFKPYLWASSRVPMVGRFVATFVNFLQSQGLDLSTLTIVGHSLGAHVAGLAARFTEGNVEHVVALDPALPNFENAGPGERVARGDAKYLEVIHTDAGVFGYVDPIGDIDFYPNGGSLQPGCVTNTCSHLRAYKYFAESINSDSGFVAVKCSNYANFLEGKCRSNTKAILGGPKPNYEAKGTYFLNANKLPPYAQGFGISSLIKEKLLGKTVDEIIEEEKHTLDPEDQWEPTPAHEVTSGESLSETEKKLANRIYFYLYTKDNPTDRQRLYLDDVDALNNSNFNVSKPTKIVTHGFLNTAYNSAVTLVRDAYLQHGDYNIIAIDWGKIAFQPYEWAAERVRIVSEFSAKFVTFLCTQGLDLSTVTIVGHSLGAHVAGLTARLVDKNVPEPVHLVVALDPALPDFALSQPGQRVARGDAKYVQVIHTNAGVFGYDEAIGDIDFYPNKGGSQPGCRSNTCAHLRSYRFFAESINSELGFVAAKCVSDSDLNHGMMAYALLGLLLIHSIGALELRRADVEALIENERNQLDPGNKLASYHLKEGTPNETLAETEHDLPNRVHFNLYTKANPTDGQRLYFGDVHALQKSNFNFSKPTIFVTHGCLSIINNDAVTLIRDAYLQHGDYNVVGIDWSTISFTQISWASDRVPIVSKYISSLINFLQNQGLNLSRVTIVGHGLGGHVAGLTARLAKGQVDHVVALDPALPNFALSQPGRRVARGDAKYVQVIHTNAGVLGYEEAIGDIDFYPNKGASQPGCRSNICSHLRAYNYFAESINSKLGFEAVKCDSDSDLNEGTCNSDPKTLLGGVNPDYNAKGVYYLTTNENSPFAKGAI